MGDCICVRRGDGPEGCGICNETGTTPDIAGLCERLRKPRRAGRLSQMLINPDGPEAADTLERQAAEIERLRGALDLLGSVPVLIIDRNAAHTTDDKAAIEYADAMLPWAKRAKAFLARAAPTGEDHGGTG